MKTEASDRLAKALRPTRVMSQSELARQLDVSPQAVSDWVRGDCQPKPELMAKIEDLLGIPMRAWTLTSGGSEDESPDPSEHSH